MYAYEWDSSTGGYVLIPTPLTFSKEPRPVYYKELDILGFDKYWKYDKNGCYPYMWAEANNYFYRGRLVAKVKGGSCYTAPEIVPIEDPEPEGFPLRFVDIPAMVEKNKEIIEQLAQDTIKKIYNTFVEYQKKVDVFYVAFSGGKDSVVTLDLVQRALPHNNFKVLFGDTGMEFPDTYKTVDELKKFCVENDIEFLTSKSQNEPNYTWEQFGPPATVQRWCCSVHKTTPQIIALRNVLKRSSFTGMAFVGVRASESISRSRYSFVCLGKKHKGQYSCNPILDWNSAEIYTYIFLNNLYLNEAYKKGNRRVGCLVCPGASEKSEYIARTCYPREFDALMNIIRKMYAHNFQAESKFVEFLKNGGWKARKNGRDLISEMNYKEEGDADSTCLIINHPKSDWREWIKTIGVVKNDNTPYIIEFQGNEYLIDVEEKAEYIGVRFDNTLAKKSPLFIKLLKNVFRKTACCIGCKECEADCHNGMIHMNNGKVAIEKNCIHCAQCHKVSKGCLVYKSLELPGRGSKMVKTKSLNCFSHHAPKMDWIQQYFAFKNDFNEKNTLGSQMFNFFKRFLKDASLLDNNGFSRFAEVIDDIGLDEDLSWALMLVNLAYNPQIGWYIVNVPFNETMSKEYICSILVDSGADEKWVNDVWASLVRILDLPFSDVGLGKTVKEKNKAVGLYRTEWQSPDERVILYSIYQFSEKCGNYKQFTLSRLLDTSIESDGVSPTQIFGLSRDTMEKILNGLTFNYPDLIEARFTLGLDNITLKSEKSAQEILNTLF